VRMSAAAVASTVFFTVPLFLVRPNSTAERTTPPSAAANAPAVAAANLGSPLAPTAEITAPPAVNTVSVVTATELAVESTPVLQPLRAQPVRTRPHAQRSPVLKARANVRTDPAPSSFKRRLVRFFSGVGRYAVKPFPSINIKGD